MRAACAASVTPAPRAATPPSPAGAAGGTVSSTAPAVAGSAGGRMRLLLRRGRNRRADGVGRSRVLLADVAERPDHQAGIAGHDALGACPCRHVAAEQGADYGERRLSGPYRSPGGQNA